MAKLTRNQQIANVINTLVVAEMMKADAETSADKRLWEKAAYRAQIALADQFNIKTPGLDAARRGLELMLEHDRKAREVHGIK